MKDLASLHICLGSHEPLSHNNFVLCIQDLLKSHGSISDGSLVGLSFL